MLTSTNFCIKLFLPIGVSFYYMSIWIPIVLKVVNIQIQCFFNQMYAKLIGNNSEKL